MPSKLRVLPLGGLGEIGKNMTVIEYDGRIVVVDTGLMFPTAEMHGIDLVLPDFSYLRDRADDIEAIVLTHGHEDHVGALPYVLREIGTPPVIYGGLLTIGMVRSKLDEHKLGESTPLQELPPGEKVKRGPFEIELIHLAHSIPDMRGVLLKTEAGSVLMTGDYKFDQTPVDGRPADVSRLAELGKEGLTLLCGDSTNADRPGVAPSESAVGPALLRAVLALQGADHRHLLRLQHPPRPAGDRRRRAARPQGGAGRALDAQELQHRLQPGDRQSAARDLHPAARDRGLPRRESRRDLDRKPGRAALGAAADGQQRPPRRAAALGRHGRLLGDAGAGQRARGERDDRPHLRDRRHRDHRQRRADPRLRPRLAGGAEADAQPDQAEVRDAGPRRPQAAATARRAGRSGRDRPKRHLPGPQRAAAGGRRATAPGSARTSTPASSTSTASTSASPTTPPCATAARSPPTASSSSSAPSPATTAPWSPTPR